MVAACVGVVSIGTPNENGQAAHDVDLSAGLRVSC